MDYKYQITNAVVKYESLFLILSEILTNFESYTEAIAKWLSDSFLSNTSNDEYIEFVMKVFEIWFLYRLSVRDEWNLVKVGIISNDSQRKDVDDYIENEKRFLETQEDKIYVDFEHVICSSDGIRLWQRRHSNVSFILITFFFLTLLLARKLVRYSVPVFNRKTDYFE
jgi:hypothetical protein